MIQRSETSIRLVEVAAAQWGLFTAAQARREGVSAQALTRLAKAGRLERLRHGVYRIAGTPPDPRDRLRSAWLALQPAQTATERLRQSTVELVCHRSAAQLHQLGDLDADRLEFITPDRRQTRDREVHLHRGTVAPDEQTLIAGLPVTTPLRTIADLASARLDGDHLAGIVRDALTTLHIDPEQIAQTLQPYAHLYGEPHDDSRAVLSEMLQRIGIPVATQAAAELVATPTASRTTTTKHATPRDTDDSVVEAQLRSALNKTLRPPGAHDTDVVRTQIEAIVAEFMHQHRTPQSTMDGT